jgi:FlaA1/EpsC-like NDP-sugar epimerase
MADVRDPGALDQLMKGVDIVLHCAGYKHVIMCERSPFDAVQTNIHGVQNIIQAAMVNRVKRVLFTSTDKAVNPTNVMGTSKLMGERLITAANSRFRGDGTIFSSTRFGNVLGSRGSVIPIFIEQIRRGGPVTLTDERMTRFIMSIGESARLVLNSVDFMCGGEVFITKMPIIRIKDLAEVMIDELASRYGHDPSKIKIKTIGAKSGEKLYEELMTGEESQRAIELQQYFSIKPAFTGIYRQIRYDYPGILSDKVNRPYISEDGPFLTKDEIKDFLLKNNLLLEADDQIKQSSERYWPGDKS